MALVVSSSTPLILLNEALDVQAASGSFCRDFSIDCGNVVGKQLFELGNGEWDIPQLRSLLTATAAGKAAIDAYEMDLKPGSGSKRRLVINAHVLDQHAESALRLVVAINDVTMARQTTLANDVAVRANEALIQEKSVLLQELNHRVANSLQIIASILMLRVRNSQSEETKMHLRDAHSRVLSIATLQRQLASTSAGSVALRAYFTDLCASIGASMIADAELLCLTVEADESVASAENAVSMGLIVTELVINSLKHAFTGGTRGSIKVVFKTDVAGWALTVSDDGVGISGNHASGKPGLGTGIVNALAAQLAATVEVSDANPGCHVAIVHREAALPSGKDK